MQLAGKLRQGIGTFDFRTNSDLQRDELAHDHDNTVFEAAYSVRPDPGLTMEAGKRAMRWGKGYAWNPIGFVERPKNPDDPELAREGYGMVDADWILQSGRSRCRRSPSRRCCCRSVATSTAISARAAT